MDPHPDFAGIELPRTFDLPGFRLPPLSPEYLDEDYQAVMSSADVLMGLFGDWPNGLTREADLIDLAWHEREFTLRRSFSWIVRSHAGDYLGCAYLFPAPGRTGQASVVTWIRDTEGRADCLVRVRRELKDWCATRLPPHIDLTWA
ncbi:MAG: hypothetical protein RIE24_15300 [Silicimonas sp.]